MPDTTTPSAMSDSATLSERLLHVIKQTVQPQAISTIKTAIGKTYSKQFKKPNKATPEQIQSALDEAVAQKELFTYPGTARGGPKYWHKPPPSVAEQVEAKVLDKVAQLGTGLFTASQIGKPGGRNVAAEALQAFELIVENLISNGQLFRVGNRFTKQAPPKVTWYESDTHKKAIKALLEKATAILTDPQVKIDDLLGFLGAKLSGKPISHVETPVLPPKPPPSSLQLDESGLRQLFRQAYDHLCKFVEFRDKLVTIPRLWHEVKQRYPQLEHSRFIELLWKMAGERVVELMEINEVHLAKERELAYQHNDRLYYYIRWVN